MTEIQIAAVAFDAHHADRLAACRRPQLATVNPGPGWLYWQIASSSSSRMQPKAGIQRM